MPVAYQGHITPGEYLARERAAERKSEYINGHIYAMAGANRVHVRITVNVTVALGNELRDKPCVPFAQDLRVAVPATGLYTHPDVIVACPPLEFDDEHEDTRLNPVAIVEVLSPSTEIYDRGDKFAHYRSVPSLKDYVLIAQDKMRLEHYTRQADNSWLLRVAESPHDTIHLASTDCRLSVAEVYERVNVQLQLGRPVLPSPMR